MSLSLILSGRHRIQKVYNYVVLLIFFKLRPGQWAAFYSCLFVFRFTLFSLLALPTQLLTDKLVRQCKWVWPARLGEG